MVESVSASNSGTGMKEWQLLSAILNHQAHGPVAESWRVHFPGCTSCSVRSAATACRCYGAGAAAQVCLKAKINLPALGTTILLLGPRTAGKLLTINKHRCAIIMGCLLRYRDSLSSPICQFKNITKGAAANAARRRCNVVIASRVLVSLSDLPAGWE